MTETSERAQLAELIQNAIGERLEHDDLVASLRSGVVLCKLINKMVPDTIPSFNLDTNANIVGQMENIGLYLKACWKLGIENSCMVTTSDIMHGKNFPALARNIRAVLALGSYDTHKREEEAEEMSADGTHTKSESSATNTPHDSYVLADIEEMVNDIKNLKKRLMVYQQDNEDLTQTKYDIEDQLHSKEEEVALLKEKLRKYEEQFVAHNEREEREEKEEKEEEMSPQLQAYTDSPLPTSPMLASSQISSIESSPSTASWSEESDQSPTPGPHRPRPQSLVIPRLQLQPFTLQHSESSHEISVSALTKQPQLQAHPQRVHQLSSVSQPAHIPQIPQNSQISQNSQILQISQNSQSPQAPHTPQGTPTLALPPLQLLNIDPILQHHLLQQQILQQQQQSQLQQQQQLILQLQLQLQQQLGAQQQLMQEQQNLLLTPNSKRSSKKLLPFRRVSPSPSPGPVVLSPPASPSPPLGSSSVQINSPRRKGSPDPSPLAEESHDLSSPISRKRSTSFTGRGKADKQKPELIEKQKGDEKKDKKHLFSFLKRSNQQLTKERSTRSPDPELPLYSQKSSSSPSISAFSASNLSSSSSSPGSSNSLSALPVQLSSSSSIGSVGSTPAQKQIPSAAQLSDQMRLRNLEIENQNLKRQYEEEVAKNNNLMQKVKSVETSQLFAEKYRAQKKSTKRTFL